MAPLTTGTASVVYDVQDMKIYPLATDAVGACPTYGTGVDIPGIAEVTLEPNLVTAELKGDARIIAKKGRTDRINISAKWGKHGLSIMQTLLSGLTGATGSTPNTQAGFRLAAPASIPYFRVDGLITDLDNGIGDLWIILWKCQITGGTLLDTASDKFSQPDMKAEGIALDGQLNKLFTGGVDVGAMIDFIYRETSVPLTTTPVYPA